MDSLDPKIKDPEGKLDVVKHFRLLRVSHPKIEHNFATIRTFQKVAIGKQAKIIDHSVYYYLKPCTETRFSKMKSIGETVEKP
jgi:hypothetical protein